MTDENQNSHPVQHKKILSLALPMAGVQFINMASTFFGLMMLSKLGHEVLAASALIYSTYISVMVIGMSVLFSLSVLVGHAFGAKNDSAIGHYVQQSWTLAILIGVINITIFLNIKHLLIWLGQDPKIASIVQTFFDAYIWGVIPLLFASCNQQFCFGIHKQKLVAVSSVLTLS